MVRTPCCSKEGLNKGAWTAHEDQILRDYINIHGEGKWRTIPKDAGLKRCGKSCRLRWLNYLKPDIKRGNISQDEEDLIIRLHKLLGNRWSLIAGRLPGRTDNEVKNYWNTTLKKKLRGDQPAESKQSNTEKKKKKKSNKSTNNNNNKTPPLSTKSQLEAKTETPHKLKAEATTNGRVADSKVHQVGFKCNDNGVPIFKSREVVYPMEYSCGELLLSDFSDSDFWKICQNNCTEDNDHIHRTSTTTTTGPGGGGATNTRIPLAQPVLFSEDLFRDWIRDDHTFRNQSI
ncbi:hypothetical protein Dsin_017946 [Dipteronia sinensis]|uniref:Myb-related protein 123 n=1 Tax=Dipteronia sinensis TaxID=43782 RepID=A0AAE0AG28_9ROSI|nr:hypothetical protein Dsin_017946 [Dipteronia sinensis]